MLILTSYAQTARHPGHRILFPFLRPSFHWSFMPFDCNVTVRSYATCSRDYVNFWRHKKSIKIILALTPSDFVAINILEEFVKTWRKNYLLVMSFLIFKLFYTISLRAITAECVAKVFVDHWLMTYGLPPFLFYDNGKQFMSWFFHISERSWRSNKWSQPYTTCKLMVKRSSSIAN